MLKYTAVSATEVIRQDVKAPVSKAVSTQVER
jgi:hypothetical protein